MYPMAPVPLPYRLKDCGTSPLQLPNGLLDLEANREETALLGPSLSHISFISPQVLEALKNLIMEGVTI